MKLGFALRCICLFSSIKISGGLDVCLLQYSQRRARSICMVTSMEVGTILEIDNIEISDIIFYVLHRE